MTPPGPGPSVLVADDSPTVRALVRLALEEVGYRVSEAADGALALQRVADELPDVVLLDLEMPVLDGYATLAALKADPRARDVPVVILTGRSATEDAVRALALGAHDYLRKPPDPAELLGRVAAALRVKALQDELRARADELERVTRTDFLTGLANRRHMEDQLRALASGGRRHGHAATVLIIDLDFFKAINDGHGHAVGDLALQQVALLLQGGLRTEDQLGRWGGEEFLVIAPMTGYPAGQLLAERVRAAVASSPLRAGPDGPAFTVTVSIGGASGPAELELLTAADRNLYRAKEAGRNQCVLTEVSAARTGTGVTATPGG